MRLPTLLILGWGSLVFGQADYPRLSNPFLSAPNDAPVQQFPWGERTANNTNPYPPNTGVVRSYNFVISRAQRSPDGYLKKVLLVNDQFPGPIIEANWGDTIQVTVTNQISDPPEGTAFHWHGILQKNSQWMDGVPGIQQCPIPPGGTFTYSFVADLYGTSWYHSHYSAQYAGGLVGPMIIYGPQTVPYDIDLGPIMLSDYFHKDYFSIIEDVISTDRNKTTPFSDNNLIQGRNNFNCSTVAPGDTTSCYDNAGISNFTFTSGKVHRLRLMNTGAEGMQHFSIDGHMLTVIANDFVPIIPYNTSVVTLAVGQRTDVLVQGVSSPLGSYFMRSSISKVPCSLTNQPDATAIVRYSSEDSGLPTTTPWPAWLDSVEYQCENDPLNQTVPWYPITPDPSPPVSQEVDIAFNQNASGYWLWSMNNVSFRTDYNQPVLLLSNDGNDSYTSHPEWNVYDFGSNSSIRILLNNPGFAAHPIHLHGHNSFILDVGYGTWNGNIVNPSNPARRDVHIVPAGGYALLQITADNPGAWPLHCHIAWHVSAGLYLTILERPGDIAKLEIPSAVRQTCTDWGTFTGNEVYQDQSLDQIDSGL